ncbi:DUF4352 domain-containing protein [Listeria valentina]|uniref:DUF4352 domain-containing protein n=1 Tax=Listeria valentina TaxID=2705293 RepID=UPI0014308C3B|nr:DUF4352 domain-containing protein [Listeria valentina]
MVIIGILGIIAFFAFVLLIMGIVFLFLKIRKVTAIWFVSAGGAVLLISLFIFSGAFLYYISQETSAEAQVKEETNASSADEFYEDYEDEYDELTFGMKGQSSEQATIQVSKPHVQKIDERGLDKAYQIEVTIQNKNSEPIYVSAKDFYLYNYGKDDYPTVLKKDYFHEKIEAGKTVNFNIYYKYLGKGELEVEYDNLIWHE